jgi:hypothetical protein
MLTILVLAVGVVMVFVLILLAVVVVGIKQEPPAEGMTSQPPNAITAWVRRLLGVYVGMPGLPSRPDEDRGEPYLTVWDPPGWPKGPAE